MKCVITDLDGTIVHNHKLSANNKRAINLLLENDIRVVFATGRSLNHVSSVYDQLGFKCDSILFNGGCFLEADGSISNINYLSEAQIDEVATVFIQNNISTIYYSLNEIYTLDLESVKESFRKAMVLEIKKDFDASYYQNMIVLNSIEELKTKRIIKCEAMEADLNLLKRCKLELNEIEGCSVVSALTRNIEVTSKEATKGEVGKWYCDKNKISLKDVVVFGNGRNDISMFEIFKNSYAVENGAVEVKNAANNICGLSYEDGFYHQIKLLLKNKGG